MSKTVPRINFSVVGGRVTRVELNKIKKYGVDEVGEVMVI